MVGTSITYIKPHFYNITDQKAMDSFRFLVTSMLGFLAFLCVNYLVWMRPRSTKSNQIKEAPKVSGAWPIIGHLHLLARRGDLAHITLGALADKYGPIFRIQLGLDQVIVVSSSEIAKECFTTNDKVLATRPSSVAAQLMGYKNAMFGFSPYGTFWRDQRKMVISEFLSTRRFESLKLVWASEISRSIRELYQLWPSQDKFNSPVLIEMKQWFADMTLNVGTKLVVGKRYSGASDENEQRRCQKITTDFSRLTGTFVVSDYLPFLGWLDLQGYLKEMKSTARELDSLVQGWLDDHKRRRQSGEAKGDEDFMSVMISILDGANLYNYDSDTINKATSFAMSLGGSHATMVTLTWALSLLLNNPHVLKTAQDELDMHIGKDNHVDESNINNLFYLQAIVKETLRLYPAVPLLAPHKAMEDCIIGGYHVRAGTRLIVNAWKIQRDPLDWSNPYKFQPERFLNKDVDVKGQSFELIPFSSGRRICPGISFALQVVSLTLARLLHEFDISVPLESNIVDMTESAGLVNVKATSLEAHLTPRQSPNFYA